MGYLHLVTCIVDEYDPAIAFFVDVLGFEVAEDKPALTNDGRAKRWVVVRPRGAETGILLARADGDAQAKTVGNQFAGRVGFFLKVPDFEESLRRILASNLAVIGEPRDEEYGRVVVFVDPFGNRWDLIGS